MPGQLLFSSGSPSLAWSFLGGVPQGPVFTRASSGSYADTSKLVVTAGANAARIAYDPATGASRGLQIEGQRTNLLFPSVYAGTGWSVVASTLTANAATAPDGTLTATTVTESTASATHDMFSPGVAVTTGTTYCFTFYARAASATAVQFFTNSAVSAGYANFDLQNGALGTSSGVTASIAAAGNGWYRCSVSFAANATQTAFMFLCFTNNSLTAGRSPSYTGVGASFFLWGLQIETGSYATSYIATTSTTATRAQDALSASPVPWFASSQGTLMIEAMIEGAGNNNLVSFDDGTSSNVLSLNATAGQALVTAGGVTQFSGTCGAFTSFAKSKIAMSFSANGVSAVKDGGTLSKSAGGITLPGGLTTLRLGNAVSGAAPLDGWLRGFTYWNYALNDSDLQKVTL